MAVSPTAADTLKDIADAIREKDSTPGSIPVSNFASRIQALPVAPPSGWPNNRRVYRFANFLTTAQQVAMQLVRLDGAPAYQALNPEIYNMFMAGWSVGQLSGLPSRNYDALQLVGDKLYLGSSTAGTTLPVLDTLTGRVTEITGLPSRPHNRFLLVGHKMYIRPSTTVDINSVVCIDTTDDTFKLISISTQGYGSWVLVGHRIFFGISNRFQTFLPYIDTNTDVGTSVSLGANDHSGALYAVGTKLYVGKHNSASQTTLIRVIDTAKIGTAESPVLPVITGFTQPRYFDTQFVVGGRYLYLGDANAKTTILRIDTTDDSWIEIGATTPLPNRIYNAFALVGNRLFVGGTTQATSVVIINHATGAFLREVTDLPNRAYTGFLLIGTNKLYVTSNTAGTTLVIIDPTIETFEEVAGLPSRAYSQFYLNGTTLYLLSATAATSIALLNTNDDTITQLPPAAPLLSSKAHSSAIAADGKLFLNSGAIIDLATNALIEEVVDWNSARMVYANDKVYAVPPVLSRSVLPSQPFPTYIKYGS